MAAVNDVGSSQQMTEKTEGKTAYEENKNHLYLELAREVADEAELSFAWQADPIKQPPVDEVTFLPVLSFYKKKITLK